MKIHRIIMLAGLFSAAGLMSTTCLKENPITDAQKLAALRHVSLTYDGIGYELNLPEGAGSGQSFASLLLEDSSTYADPANYSINLAVEAVADNTDPGEEDAKFDGLRMDLVMDDLESEPIEVESEGFEVGAGQTQAIDMGTTINMETHRNSCLYIFQQVADGEDILVTIHPYFLYKIGSLEGEIPLPAVQKSIPTTASEDTKLFLGQLLESGIFNE